MNTPKPTREYSLWNGACDVLLMSRESGFDWSIRDINSSADLENQKNKEVFLRLQAICQKIGVTDMYVPSVDFKGKVCTADDLKNSIMLPESQSLTIYRGYPAEGVDIPQGAAWYAYSADCWTIIAHHKMTRQTVAVHAGLRSLFTQDALDSTITTEPHPSIVDSVVATFKEQRPSEIEVFLTCGIQAEHFVRSWTHPQYGTLNKKVTEYFIRNYGEHCIKGPQEEGKMDLKEIIVQQLLRHGIPGKNIVVDTSIDTYSDVDTEGNYIWWSNGRGGEDKLKRNGVLVVNRGKLS